MRRLFQRSFKANSRRISGVTPFFLLWCAFAAADPPCGTWLPGNAPSGVVGEVVCETVWDPDGSGPLDSWLVVGGEITLAGNVTVNGVAAWDGTNWHALGSGLGGYVAALGVYHGVLYAAGESLTSPNATSPHGMAYWNGSIWVPVASGAGSYVYALTVFNDQLIAGGNTGLAKWNGVSWSSFGGLNGTVYALETYKSYLAVGGGFNSGSGNPLHHVGLWTGSAWQALGDGTDYEVRSLIQFGDDLIVGGDFLNPTAYVARWDGTSWSYMGGELDSVVFSLAVYDGALYAGGYFGDSPWSTTPYLARWDGSDWQGVDGSTDGPIEAMTIYNGELVVGGYFSRAGPVAARNLALWNESDWRLTTMGAGFDDAVTSLAVYNGSIAAGGYFGSAGSVPADKVVVGDGTNWAPLGSGISEYFSWVDMVTSVGDQLIVGGLFENAGGIPANSIASWSEEENWQALGGGLTLAYYTSAEVVGEFGGNMIAGGYFYDADGHRVNNIAAWDGTAWHNMGAGFDTYYCSYCYNFPYVSGLTIYNGKLIAAGYFDYSGVETLHNIAVWDGAAWHTLGGGTDYDILDVIVYHGDLIATGYFGVADGSQANCIARWDGQTWQPLGSGLTPDPNDYASGNALAIFNGNLIVGGRFAKAGGVSAHNIARWDGTTWSALGSGVDGGVSALAVYQGDLLVGGGFLHAGDGVSTYFARWRELSGDANHDGHVDLSDLALLLSDYGCAAGVGLCVGDVNGDGATDLADLALLLASFGATCP